jgi:peptidoglycan/LPS O-acetylase OafA/YrhL
MGLLRVYLALCVISTHSNSVFPWRMHDGPQAVQIFYIISGFYMAMVLSSRYATPRDFYVSRFLRIFPTYWIVLAATFVLSAASGLLFHKWLLLKPYAAHPFDHNGATGILLAAFSNITLFGQDWVVFLSQHSGHPIRFTGDCLHDVSPLWHYLLVPQCWSIGVELTFYAFVPYLNRLRSRWLAFIALGALAMRLFAYSHIGLAFDPWDYRFFPFEISLFLFGMLGYRLYARSKPYHPPQRFRCVSGFSYLIGAVTLLLLFYIHVRMVDCLGHVIGPELGVLITYPFWILGIPILFFAFGNQKIDRIIGELSYPIYLVHWIVIDIMGFLLIHFRLGMEIQGVISALVSIILAGILYRVFIAPLDKRRHILTEKKPGHAEPVS